MLEMLQFTSHRQDAEMNISTKLRHPAMQLLTTIMLSCLGTYIFSVIGSRTMANAIWLFAIPALIAIILNDSKARQLVMAGALMAASAISSIAFMVVVWGGY